MQPGHRGRAAAILTLVVLALIALAARDPRTYGAGVLCPSLRLVGVHCPGCGSTRATYDLLHGEVLSAFRHNQALLLLGVPLALWWFATLVCEATTGRRPRIGTPPWLGLVVAAALVAWGVARNLPWPAFDPIRPPPTQEFEATAESTPSAK